jgi:hypothetical protein
MDEEGARLASVGAPFITNDDGERDYVHNLGDGMAIRFHPNEQKQTAGVNRPRVATVQELKQSYMSWLKLNKPHRLECKFEKLLKDNDFEVLWTPPYCPELQPIELFWVAGKNHAALLYEHPRTMKLTVQQLREGWYGSFEAVEEGETRRKRPVNCNKLYDTSIKFANEKFIPMCQGSIKGKIGDLWIDPDYKEPDVDIPIDTLLLDYSVDAIAEEEEAEETAQTVD